MVTLILDHLQQRKGFEFNSPFRQGLNKKSDTNLQMMLFQRPLSGSAYSGDARSPIPAPRDPGLVQELALHYD